MESLGSPVLCQNFTVDSGFHTTEQLILHPELCYLPGLCLHWGLGGMFHLVLFNRVQKGASHQ